jgi:hypothetical protein
MKSVGSIVQVKVAVHGPEPGYIATPIFLVEGALAFLRRRDAISDRLGPGGIYTAGELLLLGSQAERDEFLQRLDKGGSICVVRRRSTACIHT